MITEEDKKKIEIIPVSTMSEVLKHSLVYPSKTKVFNKIKKIADDRLDGVISSSIRDLHAG